MWAKLRMRCTEELQRRMKPQSGTAVCVSEVPHTSSEKDHRRPTSFLLRMCSSMDAGHMVPFTDSEGVRARLRHNHHNPRRNIATAFRFLLPDYIDKPTSDQVRAIHQHCGRLPHVVLTYSYTLLQGSCWLRFLNIAAQ